MELHKLDYDINKNFLDRQIIENVFDIKREYLKETIEIIFKILNYSKFPIGGVCYNILEKKIYFNI